MGKHDATPAPFGAAPTVLADAKRLRDLIDEMQAPAELERETRRMEAEQFRALLRTQPAEPPRQLDDIIAPASAEPAAVEPAAAAAAAAVDEPASNDEPAPSAAPAATEPTRAARWPWIAAAISAAIAGALLIAYAM